MCCPFAQQAEQGSAVSVEMSPGWAQLGFFFCVIGEFYIQRFSNYGPPEWRLMVTVIAFLPRSRSCSCNVNSSSSSSSFFFTCIFILAQKQPEVNPTKQRERNTEKEFLNLIEVDKMQSGSKAEFTHVIQVTHFWFSSLKWHRSDLQHRHVSGEKKHMNLDVVRSQSGLLHMWK